MDIFHISSQQYITLTYFERYSFMDFFFKKNYCHIRLYSIFYKNLKHKKYFFKKNSHSLLEHLTSNLNRQNRPTKVRMN